MRSLVYLVATEFKNMVKEIFRKPGKLALYLFIIVSIVGLLVLSMTGRSIDEMQLPLYWLQGIVFAFISLFLVIGVQKGLTSGDAIFDMNDVNFLFTSPVNPRIILLYGLVKMAKTSFLAGFFILFQSNTFAIFGVDFGGLLIVFLLFMLSIIAQSLLSLLIYSVSNGKPRRKMVVRVIAVAAFVPLVLFYGWQLLATGSPLMALEASLQSAFMNAVPIAGWAAASSCAFISGDVLAGIGWLALLLAGCGVMLAYIVLSRVDYYEDVLVATETAFEKKRAMAEGDVQAATMGSGKTRVTKTGLQGFGASVFFYKHLRETFRQNRFGFFSLSTIIMFAVAVVVSFAMREELDLTVILQVLMWIQVFLIGTGRGLKEVYVHYIFLVPEPPFNKIVWSNLELVFKTFLESLLLLLVPGIILGTPPLVVFGSILAYTLFSLLLLGINYLSLRWTEVNISQGVMIAVYFLAVVVFVAPGLAAALVVGFAVGGEAGILAGLGILSGWELIAALICFFFSKNVLHSIDMPSMKVG